MPSFHFDGFWDGKNAIFKSTIGNRSYTPLDVEYFLGSFRLNQGLTLIGSLSFQHFFKKESRIIDHYLGHNQVLITNWLLAFAAMRLIESSDDAKQLELSIDDIARVCDMWVGLPEKDPNTPREEIILQTTNSQFDYNFSFVNVLARTLKIFRDLWGEVLEAKTINIDAAIKELTGLGLEEVIAIGWLIAWGAYSTDTEESSTIILPPRGYFRVYQIPPSKSQKLNALYTPENQRRFLEWVSIGYEDFRKQAAAEAAKRAAGLERFRFNPLRTYPVLRPDVDLAPDGPTWLIPIPMFLFEKTTLGLYHSLSELHKTKSNPQVFRSAFGFVFQKYVEWVLEEGYGQQAVMREFKYKTRDGHKDTSDCLLVAGDTMVLVEAKQAGLYLESRTWPEISKDSQLRQDIKKVLASAVTQIWKFENHLKETDRYSELDILRVPTRIERLIVTFDKIHYANGILRDLIREELDQQGKVPRDFHWQIISIDELEQLVNVPGYDLFQILREKRFRADWDTMDFRDYMGRRWPNVDLGLPALNQTFSYFFDEFAK